MSTTLSAIPKAMLGYLLLRGGYSALLGTSMSYSPFSYIQYQDNKLRTLKPNSSEWNGAMLLARTIGAFNLGVAHLFLYAAQRGSLELAKNAFANGICVRFFVILFHLNHGAWSSKWLLLNMPFFLADTYFLLQ